MSAAQVVMGTDGRCCVTKGKIRISCLRFCCRAGFLSSNVISGKVAIHQQESTKRQAGRVNAKQTSITTLCLASPIDY